jgi:outer membrane murein-binding lipoprotein Lpp
MAAKDQPKRSPQQAPPPPAWPAWAALVGVGLVLAVNLTGWSNKKKDHEALEGRFANLEASVAQLTTKVDQAAKAARPPRQGPDPDKVYTVKTGGAPSKGRVGAPILIAEFSDFQ